jgi:hypothetical protein
VVKKFSLIKSNGVPAKPPRKIRQREMKKIQARVKKFQFAGG